jgi:uncharacterized lipoprotein YehR (DUF1307 family)
MKQKNLFLILALILTIIFNACEKEKDLEQKKIDPIVPIDPVDTSSIDTTDIVSYIFDTVFINSGAGVQIFDSAVYHKYNESNLNLKPTIGKDAAMEILNYHTSTYLCPFLIEGTDSLVVLAIINPGGQTYNLNTFKYKISYKNSSIIDSRFEKLNENVLESIDSLLIENICYVTTNFIKTERFKEIKWEIKDYIINSFSAEPVDITILPRKFNDDTLKLRSTNNINLDFVILNTNENNDYTEDTDYFEAIINLSKLAGSDFKGIFYNIEYLSTLFNTTVTTDLNNVSVKELFKIVKVNNIQKDFPKTPLSVLTQTDSLK